MEGEYVCEKITIDDLLFVIILETVNIARLK